MADDRSRLIALLQLAYSGEMSAAYAYRGHWKSVSVEAEQIRIAEIEEDEWRHRRQVGEMLSALRSSPDSVREARASFIGRILGFMCHLSGWLLPMYGAGKLESGNIREYEAAARFARGCDRTDLVDCLLEMAEVEWDHEHYFRRLVVGHWLGRHLPIWPEPPAKANIRTSFENEDKAAIRAGTTSSQTSARLL